MGLKASWRRCYYPHRLRNSVSPVCGIFSFIFRPKEGSFGVEVGWCNCSAILSVKCFFVYFFNIFNIPLFGHTPCVGCLGSVRCDILGPQTLQT